MAKELERAGLPTVTVTSLAAVALKVGANRVLRGTRFSHPCGNPGLNLEDEQLWRINFVRAALKALQTKVEGPTLFDPGYNGKIGAEAEPERSRKY